MRTRKKIIHRTRRGYHLLDRLASRLPSGGLETGVSRRPRT